MNLKELKELIDIFTSREAIEELEVEKSGFRLKVRRQSSQPVALAPVPAAVHLPPQAPGLPAAQPAPVEDIAVVDDLFYVKAPIVGTFYKATNPTSAPFVAVGDVVEKGAVLCIVEAMKLMNEIESEVAGQITAIFVENGQPVEYGERLFAIRKK
jgi:acetyl-CoA carboxylase biotin carboxyl carrier protein